MSRSRCSIQAGFSGPLFTIHGKYVTETIDSGILVCITITPWLISSTSNRFLSWINLFIFFPRLTVKECSVIKFELFELIVVVSQLPPFQLHNIDFIVNGAQTHTHTHNMKVVLSYIKIQVQTKRERRKKFHTDPSINKINFWISIKLAITSHSQWPVYSWYINENDQQIIIDKPYYFVVFCFSFVNASSSKFPKPNEQRHRRTRHKCKWVFKINCFTFNYHWTNQTSIYCLMPFYMVI